MFIYVYFKFEEFFNFLSKHVYTYDIMICLLSFLKLYIYIKFEEFSRVLSYKNNVFA